MKNTLTFSNISSVAAPLFGLAVMGTAIAAIIAPVPASAQGPAAVETTRAQAETRADSRFDRIDLNKDGVLDAEDRQTRHRARFDAMDSNGNGAISFDEFEALRGKAQEKLADAGAKRGENRRGAGRSGARRGGVGRGGFGQHQMARLADANSDGKVSKQEFRTLAMQRFERADTDNDGTISVEERRSRKGGMRGMGRHGRKG